MSTRGRTTTTSTGRTRPRRPESQPVDPRAATEVHAQGAGLGLGLGRAGAHFGTPVDRFRVILYELGLGDWQVVDGGETAGDDCAAAVSCSDDYHVVDFATSREHFPHSDPSEALRVLLHEAAHVLFADYSHAAEAAAAGLPEPAKSLAETHLRRQEELVADRLASILLGYRRGEGEQ